MKNEYKIEVEGKQYLLLLEGNAQSHSWVGGNSETGDTFRSKHWYAGVGCIYEKGKDASTKQIFSFATYHQDDSPYSFTFEEVFGFDFNGEKNPDLFTPETKEVKERFIDLLCGPSGIMASADRSHILPSVDLCYSLFANFSKELLAV